ncbi:MAG: gamma-glutamyltransferase [Acidobacteriota bacterium]
MRSGDYGNPKGLRLRSGSALVFALTLIVATSGCLQETATETTTQKSTGGAIASAEPRATEAGLAILASGGNAVDAAVATALALAVTYPEAGNLGGGGFAVLKIGDERNSLDFREVAPAAAHRDMYLDADGTARPEASLIGPLAAGVPGSPQGLWALHQRYGKLPWPEVVDPAIELARDGIIVDEHLRAVLAEEQPMLSRFPETAAFWLPDGEPPAVGTRLRQPALESTLRAYAEQGPSALTAGAIAAAVERTSRQYGGVLTAADLAAYEPVWRAPVETEAFGWKIASMDLPSSGGLLLAQTFALLERRGWQEQPRFGTERAHLLTEAWRRAYADRLLMGDPATSEAGGEQLLASAWLDRRAQEIDPESATSSNAVGNWSDSAPPTEPQDTTHLSVIDGDGNLVALTTTLNGLFGCGVWVPEAGFFLNNEMDDFTTAVGQPNLYNLIQGEANAVAPGKRMLSSMTPTVAWQETGGAIVLGGRGGSKIPSNTMQVLLNYIADGDALQTAVDRPRIHHQWLPDELQAEPQRLAPEVRQALEERGHRVVIVEHAAKVQAVAMHSDGTLEAAADPRSTGQGGVLHRSP